MKNVTSKTVIAISLFLISTGHAAPPRYRTPYQGPVVAEGRSVDRSGNERHEQVGRFAWGTKSTSDSSKSYQHQTDGSYYRDRERTTTQGYYRSPFGNGDSRKVDTSGSDRYYDHNGDPSRILSMYQHESQLRVQRLLERYDRLRGKEAEILALISRGRAHLNNPEVQSKLTSEELRGMRDSFDRAERELAGYRAERLSLASEINSLRR